MDEQATNSPEASGGSAQLLPIGEFARLAGTTTRAVRHYHSIGLLPEPERDASGYRRYGAADLVALVRVVRLRAVGMSTVAIAERMGSESDGTSLGEALTELASEIQTEIDQLEATRDRVRALAASQAFERPVAAVTQALRGHGLLGEGDELGSAEEGLVTLLDALAPSGLSGLLARADNLLSDPSSNDRLSALFEEFRGLNESSSDDEIARLAREVAAVLPKRLRRRSIAPVDLAVMDNLLADDLSPAQLRFLDHLDQRLTALRRAARARPAR
jgi:DNA-binding transcriptional MerR regulator